MPDPSREIKDVVMDPQLVEIDYTNYRGERAKRRIKPVAIEFGTSQWHSGEQWLLIAIDVERDVTRSFAMKDIHSWSMVKE
jgi:predicted DNA-binding transcriptional regulator YafY